MQRHARETESAAKEALVGTHCTVVMFSMSEHAECYVDVDG